MGLRAGNTGAATAVSQRRADVWKNRVAEGPLLARPRAPSESIREFILDVSLSKVVCLLGDTSGGEIEDAESWCLDAAIQGSTGAGLSECAKMRRQSPNPNPNPGFAHSSGR